MRVAVIMNNDYPAHVVVLDPTMEEDAALLQLQRKFQEKRIAEFRERRPGIDPEAHPFEVGHVHVHAFEVEK